MSGSQKMVNNSWIPLSSRAIERLFENNGTLSQPMKVQLTNFKKCEEAGAPGTYFFLSSTLSSQINFDGLVGKRASDGRGDILLLKQTHFSTFRKTSNGSTIVIIDEYELVAKNAPLQNSDEVEYSGIIEVDRNEMVTPDLGLNPSVPNSPSTSFALNEPPASLNQSIGSQESNLFTDMVVQDREIQDNTAGPNRKSTLRFNIPETIGQSAHVPAQSPVFIVNACQLDMIGQYKDETINVLAVVDKMDPVNDFTSMAGKSFTKRDIYLIDKSSTIVVFTLWNDMARQFEDHALGQVLGITGARVKEYKGTYSLGSIAGTKWEFFPQSPEGVSLYNWYRDERPSLRITFPSNTKQQVDGLRTLGWILARKVGTDSTNGVFVNAKAMIQNISKNVVYKACVTCKKKVVEVDCLYRCDRCDVSTATFNYNYVELADCTGCFYVTAFSSVGERLFGRTAQEMGELMENDKSAYDQVIKDSYFKNFIWNIRAKEETYQGVTRVKYTVIKAPEDVNWEAYVADLTKTVNSLEGIFSA